MKTLTTLTAVAALVAGVSFASAQMSPPSGSSSSPGASSGSSGSPQQAARTGRYCIEAAGGALNRKYASLSTCQKDAKAAGQNCSPNPNSGTTGSKD